MRFSSGAFVAITDHTRVATVISGTYTAPPKGSCDAVPTSTSVGPETISFCGGGSSDVTLGLPAGTLNADCCDFRGNALIITGTGTYLGAIGSISIPEFTLPPPSSDPGSFTVTASI
jgi:hypothetical protein